MIIKNIKNEVSTYYSNKHKEHGNTHLGVDWNSIESQEHRFLQLSNILPQHNEFNILDYGCGYGALWPYLKKKSFKLSKFIGFDISEEMIQSAKALYRNDKETDWVTNVNNIKVDYIIASGIFNVKLRSDDNEWLQYIKDTLNEFDRIAQKGFSFNILTSYSDNEYKKDYLYYADPLFFFDYCKKNFSRNIALLHDYDLYEFTILVRK